MTKISIIIPTLNEELIIGKCLEQFDQYAENQEIIVVDGGSHDKTLSVVDTFQRVTLVQATKKGRACQMNLVANAAKGEILLFLHADTLLPPDGIQLIEKAVNGDGVVGGSFYLCFNHRSLWLKLHHLVKALLSMSDVVIEKDNNSLLYLALFPRKGN